MNQTEFANHMGWTKGRVSQLKAEGRLVFTENGALDVEASILRIAQTEDPNRDDVKARHAAERAQSKQIDKPKKESKAHDPNQITFSEGRAKEQHFKALQAELEYKKTIGELVAKDDMKLAVEDVVTTFRQKLENLPHSLSAELVGKDMDYIRSTLKQALHAALSDLSREFNEKVNVSEAESV